MSFALEHPAHVRITFGAGIHDKAAHPALEAAAGRASSLLVGTITDTQHAGAARRGDAEQMAVAGHESSFVHGLSALLIDARLKGHAPTVPEAEILARRVTKLLSTSIVDRGRTMRILE